MVGKRISERAGLYAHSWVDEHSGGLDDYDDVLIFVNNFERNWLGPAKRRARTPATVEPKF